MSTFAQRTSDSSTMVMEPLISLTIVKPKPFFRPGDELVCEYQIDAIGEDEIVAVEASVLWYAEGKGDEDLGLHFFERRLPGDVPDGDLRELHRFRTICPNSPLSYDGQIVSVKWCVRVRVFLPRAKEIFFELPFRLGELTTMESIRDDEPTSSSEPVVEPKELTSTES